MNARILIIALLAVGALAAWLVLVGPSGREAPSSHAPGESGPPSGASRSQTERSRTQESQIGQVDLPLREPGASRTYIVLMRAEGGQFVFDPAGLRVQPGDTVRWFNLGDNHSTTAYHPGNGKELRIPEGAEPWDSGVLGIGDAGFTLEYTFNVEGTYDYYCTPHEFLGMVGRIVNGRPGGPAEEKPLSVGLPDAAQQEMPSTRAVMTGLGAWAAELNLPIWLVFERDYAAAVAQVDALIRDYEGGKGAPASLYGALERLGLHTQFGELLSEYRDLLASQGGFREVELKADELKALLTEVLKELS
jgi:plastocyanin